MFFSFIGFEDILNSMFGGTAFNSDGGRNATLNSQKIGKTIAIPPSASRSGTQRTPGSSS